jgi:outer membrane protein assembly factor BamC
MKAIRLKYISLAVLLATTVSGCGAFSSLDEVIPDNSKKYRKADTMPPLDVPPDLSTSRINDDIAGNQTSTATYSEFEEAANNPLASKYNITPETKPALAGEGDKRHLIVPGDREQIWSQILDFWAQKNIEVVRKDLRIGLMDTETAPDDYTYRVRMERGDTSKTSSVYVSAATGEDNVPKNEAMLRQLADFLGVLYQEQQAQIEAVKESQPQTATVKTQLMDDVGNQKALLVDQDFSDVWNRVGRVLDSKGFAVEDRDRSRGTYFVRYLDPMNNDEGDEPGLLSKLAFWKDDVEKTPGEFYYIKLISDAEKTKIVILDAEQVRTSSDTAQRLLTLMQEQLQQ